MYRVFIVLAVVTLAIAAPTPPQPDIKPKAGLLPYQFAVDVNSTDAAYLCFDFGVDPTCNQGLCANKVTGSSGRIALRDLQLRVVACASNHENSTMAKTSYTFEREVLPISGSDFAVGISLNRLALTGSRTSGSMNYFTRRDGEPWLFQQTRPSVPNAGAVAMSDEITMIGSWSDRAVMVHFRDDSFQLRSPQASSGSFGHSVALSPNDEFALISDIDANTHGEVYVYNTTTWNVTQTLPLGDCVDPSVLEVFGYVVRTDGLHIVVQSYQALMIYAKDAISRRWSMEQCIHTITYGEWLDIDGNFLFVGESGYDGGKGAVHVYERVSGTWTNTTILRGRRDFGDLTPKFGAFVLSRAGHLVVGHGESMGGVSSYLHVFSVANGWSERVIKHPSVVSFFAMSSRHALFDNIIYPLELQTANNIVVHAAPLSVERDNLLTLQHAIGANATCKFFSVSATSFLMEGAFSLDMYSTTTTVLAPASAGQYELRCRSAGLQDTVQQQAVSITVSDVCMAVPCLHGAVCEHSTTHNPQYICHCVGGFSGRDCDQHACSLSRCMNGGTCTYLPSNATLFTCACPLNFWGTLCENYGGEPASSSSTGGFVPDPRIIVVRLTMHTDKQPEFLPFREAFMAYLVSLCREQFDATACDSGRFDVVHLGQRTLSHWPWALLAAATHELTVDLHILTKSDDKVPGTAILQFLVTRVTEWSKSGVSQSIGGMTLTLPSDPLHIQCADGTFQVTCPVPGNDATLATGAIIGIVIGCVVALGAGIFLAWLFCIHKRQNATCATVATTAISTDSKLPVVPQSINIHISDTAASSNSKDSTHVELATTSTDAATTSGSAASLEGASASVDASKRPSLPGVVHSRDSMT